MTHFSDTLWYTPIPMEHSHSLSHSHPHHQKAFPLYYSPQPHQHPPLPADSDSDNSGHDRSAAAAAAATPSSPPAADREHMFEKPLTPSDVGKLNRLVIPKQHAERFFPLASSPAPDPSSPASPGLLLGFEDESGKCWRFRYSYWNSSQSYVLTKGWSRYVKEKKLDAGDVVLFDRHRLDPDHFFIGWRRRGLPHPPPPHFLSPLTAGQRRASTSGFQVGHPHPYAPPQGIIPSYQYQPADCLHAGAEIRHPTMGQQPGKSSSGNNSRRLRLFGVNLECQLEDDPDEEPQTSDGSSLGPGSGLGSGSGSGSGSGHAPYGYFDYVGYPANHHNHMDIN